MPTTDSQVIPPVSTTDQACHDSWPFTVCADAIALGCDRNAFRLHDTSRRMSTAWFHGTLARDMAHEERAQSCCRRVISAAAPSPPTPFRQGHQTLQYARNPLVGALDSPYRSIPSLDRNKLPRFDHWLDSCIVATLSEQSNSSCRLPCATHLVRVGICAAWSAAMAMLGPSVGYQTFLACQHRRRGLDRDHRHHRLTLVSVFLWSSTDTAGTGNGALELRSSKIFVRSTRSTLGPSNGQPSSLPRYEHSPDSLTRP